MTVLGIFLLIEMFIIYKLKKHNIIWAVFFLTLVFFAIAAVKGVR